MVSAVSEQVSHKVLCIRRQLQPVDLGDCVILGQHSMKRDREEADGGTEDSKHCRLETDAATDGEDVLRAEETSGARTAEPASVQHSSDAQRGSLAEPSREAGAANGVTPAGQQRGARQPYAEPLDGGGNDEGAPGSKTQPISAEAEEEEEEDDDDDAPVMPQPQRMRVRKGTECPYLDTISRQVPPCFHCAIAAASCSRRESSLPPKYVLCSRH